MSEFNSFLRQHDKPTRPAVRETRTAPSLDEQVEVLKETLHKKIDACFIRYGLTGLEKIDEAIANTLREFIDGKKKKPSAISPLQTNFSKPVEHHEEEVEEDDYVEMDETMLAAQIIDALPAEENVNEEPQYVSSTNNLQNTNQKTNSVNEQIGTSEEANHSESKSGPVKGSNVLPKAVDAFATAMSMDSLDAIGAALENL